MNALLLIVESSGLNRYLNNGANLLKLTEVCVALSGSFLSMLTITAFIVLSFKKFGTSTPGQWKVYLG